MPDLLLSPLQAADACGLSVSYLARLRQEGDARRPGLPVGPAYVRVGRAVRYRPADLAAWVCSLGERPALPPVIRRGRPTKAATLARRALAGEGAL